MLVQHRACASLREQAPSSGAARRQGDWRGSVRQTIVAQRKPPLRGDSTGMRARKHEHMRSCVPRLAVPCFCACPLAPPSRRRHRLPVLSRCRFVRGDPVYPREPAGCAFRLRRTPGLWLHPSSSQQMAPAARRVARSASHLVQSRWGWLAALLGSWPTDSATVSTHLWWPRVVFGHPRRFPVGVLVVAPMAGCRRSPSTRPPCRASQVLVPGKRGCPMCFCMSVGVVRHASRRPSRCRGCARTAAEPGLFDRVTRHLISAAMPEAVW